MARGRVAGFKIPEEHRHKIANSNILKRLIDYAEGKEGVEMSSGQVQAALGLMRKVLPDLSNTEISGPGEDGSFVFKVVYER